MIEVVNVHTCKDYDVYGGRGKLRPHVTEIGERGWLGNPFHMKSEEDRERVIAQYRRYFWRRINSDPEFYQAILSLDNCRVACYCAPKHCHLDIINDWFKAGCPLKQEHPKE